MKNILLLALLGAVACGGASAPASPGGPGSVGPRDSTSADGGLSSSGTVGTVGAGLPCEIVDILGSSCLACHTSPPISGVPMPLTSYADLTAPAHSDPSKTVAAVAVTRIQSTSSPMPPVGNTPLTDAQKMAFVSWVNSGTPMGTCGVDAGATSNIYDTPVTCTSGIMSNVREGRTMRPGDTCVSCHAQSGGEAPLFSIGGTVYPSAHEPTNCVGVNVSGANVVVTDANGKVVSLPVNSAGNFYYEGTIAVPFHAKVVYQGRERAMSASQTTGDCNSCHTETGAMSAPGRIMLP